VVQSLHHAAQTLALSAPFLFALLDAGLWLLLRLGLTGFLLAVLFMLAAERLALFCWRPFVAPRARPN